MAEPEHSSPSPIAVVPTDIDDSWLEDLAATEEHHSSSASHWRPSSSEAWRHFQRWLGSTPGRMILVCLLLSLAILAAGFSVSQNAAERRTDLQSLTQTTEPVSYLVQDLYSELSIADTTATTGFIRAGVETSGNRELYGQAVQAAAEGLIQVAAALPEDAEQEIQLVLELNEVLPTYTGLVETAWANNRQGNPVGAAYMALASSVMQDQILPQAAKLHSMTSQAVLEDQQSLSRPLWLPISGMLAAVAFLLLAQLWLFRVTRRRLNAGLLIATILMSITSLWAIATSLVTWSSGSTAFYEAAHPIEQLTTARIAAQQIRSQETLALVGRTHLDDGTQSFQRTMDEITAALDTYGTTVLAQDADNSANLAIAYAEVENWNQEHDVLALQLGAGDYETALETMLSSSYASSDSTTATFQKLDDALAALIDSARGELKSQISQSSVASAILSRISGLAFILSLIAIWVGIWPRLQEYR